MYPAVTDLDLLGTSATHRSWYCSAYDGLREFHQAKGFDPDSQDVAQHPGYPLYEVTPGIDARFAFPLPLGWHHPFRSTTAPPRSTKPFGALKILDHGHGTAWDPPIPAFPQRRNFSTPPKRPRDAAFESFGPRTPSAPDSLFIPKISLQPSANTVIGPCRLSALLPYLTRLRSYRPILSQASNSNGEYGFDYEDSITTWLGCNSEGGEDDKPVCERVNRQSPEVEDGVSAGVILCKYLSNINSILDYVSTLRVLAQPGDDNMKTWFFAEI
ncbi:hypothetical protein GGX14DRAFT_397649 [Mycena pura]|uniref:Uncharacterized protein n=1 Tax=Mycena pura TaxID=153505 RepID=A0AAD6V852_9AGAR|nr:hypothetical protein GGX14DRAFT_397649 [Mycena pura]